MLRPTYFMRATLLAASLLSGTTNVAFAQTMPAPTTPAPTTPVPTTPAAAKRVGIPAATVAAGIGAIAGVVVVNAAMLGLGAFPGGLAYAAGATVPGEMAVAINRVHTVVSAVAGAWFAEYLYAGQQTAPAQGWTTNRALSAAAGAVGGIVAFGLLTGPLVSTPFAGGAVAAVPVSVVAGSRILAAASAGAGALGGTWLYGRMSGERIDMAGVASAVGGALGAVALGNLLVSGQFGIIPYYAGAGAAEVGSGLATTAVTAASRVYAVAFGAVGAVIGYGWYQSAAAPR